MFEELTNQQSIADHLKAQISSARPAGRVAGWKPAQTRALEAIIRFERMPWTPGAFEQALDAEWHVAGNMLDYAGSTKTGVWGAVERLIARYGTLIGVNVGERII